ERNLHRRRADHLGSVRFRRPFRPPHAPQGGLQLPLGPFAPPSLRGVQRRRRGQGRGAGARISRGYTQADAEGIARIRI
ncbi:MAG: hypothetical protein AVDCRST_MAG68-3451, partial [uncultured Gemmatimonadetes bacterium]